MAKSSNAQQWIGRCIRILREHKKLTLEELAAKSNISYQYLSGMETGKENFTLSVLEAIAVALDSSIPQIVTQAYRESDSTSPPVVLQENFRPGVPLPEGLTAAHLEAAMNQTQLVVHRINRNLINDTGKPLQDFIQGNNFSGMVSNIFSDAMNDHSPYKHNHSQRYPDLINEAAKNGKGEGLEIKTTIKIGKGGESHNGHSGWHAVACYQIDAQGDIYFVHLMLAVLNGHQHEDSDWKYVGSKTNVKTGSQRTETYNTTRKGSTKLRDASIYLDRSKVKTNRWRQERNASEAIPLWSVFYPQDD